MQMYASVTGGSQSALAAIDVPRNGKLTCVTWNCYADLDADVDLLFAQLSFGSVGNTQNDVRHVISNCVMYAPELTAVGAVTAYANYSDPMDLPVAGGERIYVHSLSTASITGVIVCVIQFDFDIPGGRR